MEKPKQPSFQIPDKINKDFDEIIKREEMRIKELKLDYAE